MRNILVLSVIAGGCFLTGCTTLVEKGGRLLDGSAFAERTVEVYRSGGKSGVELRRIQKKAGGEFIAISLDAMPALRLEGSIPGPGGGFNLTALYFLHGGVLGWNEFTMDISGSGVFMPRENGASLKLDIPVEILGLSRGKIRHQDRRISGDEALSALEGRYERIGALTEWMLGRSGAPAFADQKTFEAYWKPILLPEMTVPGKRPKTWTRENARWVRAEDVRWNQTYTEELFPAELWALRNSGALLRDWEEAAGWIYLSYEWERMTMSLNNEISLLKIK
ncbi:MAG: hypothetical protein LBP32_03680 [Spirochaetaceae bacterium]|jgi:hypothetical protein|nr:hypothetical protein [Spirochaetaceae bacterium]